MAYNNRFRFRFESVNGVEYNIYILKDGYSGTCEQRALGRGPMLKKKRNGPICGTSLELYAECATDGEFAELYTSDPKKFRADVYRGSNMIWTGFVSTELYSEPSIAPPYDVQIVATDGLGELKQVYFEAPGEISLKALFAQLLSFTGSDRGFYFATNLRHTGGTKSQMLNWTINVDFLDGETCYNVLTKLLESLHATITTYNGRWLIARETDIETLLNSSAGLAVISYSNGTVSTTTIGNVVKTLGQMGQADIHPWGNLSTTIEPARKSVVVAAPWYMRGYLEDPDMEENPPVHWVPGGYTEKITHDNGFYVGNNRSKVDTLYQDIPMEYLSSGLKFTVRAFGSNTTGNGHCELRLYAEWRVDGNNPIVGTERGWRSNSWEDVASIDLGEPQIWPNWQDYSITLKKLGATVPGTLRLVIQAKNVRVTYANLELVHEAGYEDTIHIDNGARGEADEVEIIGSRIPAEGLENKNFYQGFWKYSGEELITFEDSNHSNGDFLSIQALDRAVSVALARTKTQGLINIPSEASTMPLLVKQDSQNSWVETWEWDLREDEVTIQALSTPNAEIDIDSEEVVPMTGGGSSSGGSSSGGSGGGSSSGSGTNLLSVWRSLTNNDDLDDYDSETKIAIEHLSTFLEVVEYTSGHYALKTKASVPFNGDVVDIDGFYSDGFVDSGGVSPGGGGGGGNVDMVEVWASLQNTATDTSRNAWKFSTAHLPTLGAGLAYTDNADSGAGLATSLGIASTHYLPTAQEWAGVASNLEGLQAMQAQIDALASRDNFDELTATAFFADVAAVSALYAGAINLNGQDVGTLLSHGETAYGWGDHAQAGYFAASSFTAANIVSTLGTTAVNRATADASGNNIANTYATATALGAVSGRVETLESRQNWDEIFGIDSDGNVYIKKQTVGGVEVARGFWNYGFVDSGGAASGGGGGGGADITEVWASLQNTATDTSRNAWKFSTAHLPTLGAGLTYTDNADSGAGLATSLGIASTHYLPTAQEWAGVASNLEGLQAMQAQIDALASRDNFDELTATAFFADVAAVSALYAYSIELNGADLETTLSGKQATISDLSTIRSRADEGHTAYGWGNHANAGYFAASSFTAANIVSTLGTTAVNRATADAAGENIADNFTTVSKALQSLQAQLNSVATRSVLDELSVANLFTDTLAASKIFAETIDFGGYVLGASGSVMQWNGSALFSTMSSSAGTNLSITVGGQNRTATLYATYDSASENISDKFGIVSTALQSLQKQIDSVAAAVGNSDEIYAGCASFDTLAVGSGIYAGSLLATGYVNSGASASSSDAKLKNNIEEISAEKAVSLLMELRGVEWDWNEKKACLEGRHGSGLVAQEVEKVMPWMVLDLNGELSLTYSSLWGVAIPVMQSHEERIAALERENAELKKRLNTITH